MFNSRRFNGGRQDDPTPTQFLSSKPIGIFTLLIYSASIIAYPTLSWGNTIPTSLPNNGTTVSCASTCSIFTSGKNGVGLLINSNTWNTSDDMLCTELYNNGLISQPTNASIPSFTPSSVPTSPSGGPNVAGPCASQVSTSDIYNALQATGVSVSSDGNGVCNGMQTIIDQCQYHNSQLEQYCMTYNAIKGPGKEQANALNPDIALMAVDVAVTAACAAACFASGTAAGPTLEIACGIMGVGEGIAELAETSKLQHDDVTKYIDSIGGSTLDGLGIAGGTVSALGGAAGLTRQLNKADILGTKDAEGFKTLGKGGRAAGKAASCASAAFFAAMAALRAADIAVMVTTANNACSSIQNLFSNAPAPNPTSTNTANNSDTSSGSDTSSSDSSSSAGNSSSPNASEAQINSVLTCMQQSPPPTLSQCMSTAGLNDDTTNPTSTSSEGATGLDQGLLGNNPQLGSLLSQVPNLPAMANTALTSGVGAALGGALPPGDAANALVGLANAIQKNPSAYMKAFHVGSASYSGAGAGDSNSGGHSSLLSSFLGGGRGLMGGSGKGSKMASFSGGRAPASADIWHTGTTMNLFEIVSNRIEKVSNRVK